MLRILRLICLSGLITTAMPLRAASASFDLAGPALSISVARGARVLPLAVVPNMAEGDVVSVRLERAGPQTERYRIVAGFLRGAVDRPPKSWFHAAESWKPGDGALSVTVPKGAQQMAVFILPESGGRADAIIAAVRKQPGAFVRAIQGVNQASLDRARLEMFLRQIAETERKDPAALKTVSPALTHSLAIRLKAECLQRAAEVQVACLTDDRDTLVMADTHSSALADTLAGTPTDLAFHLSATPQAGYGSYSPYIGVVRDLFRLFGAFQSTQLQFIPALLKLEDKRAAVLLNTPLSFAKPASVMVIALPAIEPPKPPPLRRPDPDAALCALPGLALPVEGAPLIYATQYAHDMALRVTGSDGSVHEIPVRADARRGGFVMDGALPAGPFAPVVAARLHGQWGFAPFDGPVFDLSPAHSFAWTAEGGGALVAGRSNAVTLRGGSIGCVRQVGMRRGNGPVQAVEWAQAGKGAITATLPLQKIAPGPVSIVIEGTAGMDTATLTLAARQESGSADDLVFHAGDDEAVLIGARLDQVKAVTIAGAVFQLGALSRAEGHDRLVLTPVDAAAARLLVAGTTVQADVRFADKGRKTLAVTIGPPLDGAVLLRISAQAAQGGGALPIVLQTEGVFAQNARLAFAFRLEGTAALNGQEMIEIGTVDGRASKLIGIGKGYDLQDTTTGIVAFDPVTELGPLAYGDLRFRVVRDGAASRWTRLATIVRLPEISKLHCARSASCVLTGERLFLIKSIAPGDASAAAQEIPDGFVAPEIKTRAAANGRLYLRPRDAPDAIAVIAAP